MVDYQNGKIYRLVHGDVTFYVGSTATPLRKRKNSHKCDTKRKDYPVQKYIRKIGLENFRIVLIEEYPCANKDELTAREQYWIDRANESFGVVDLKNKMRAFCAQDLSRAENVARCRRWYNAKKVEYNF